MKDLTKRYFVFTFGEYYPSGGLNDIEATFDNLNEAKKSCTDGSIFISSDYCYIWDKQTGEIVFDLYE